MKQWDIWCISRRQNSSSAKAKLTLTLIHLSASASSGQVSLFGYCWKQELVITSKFVWPVCQFIQNWLTDHWFKFYALNRKKSFQICPPSSHPCFYCKVIIFLMSDTWFHAIIFDQLTFPLTVLEEGLPLKFDGAKPHQASLLSTSKWLAALAHLEYA